MTTSLQHTDFGPLARQIKQWAGELGFQQAGICDTDLELTGARLQQWLQLGYHGGMDYMRKHGSKRYRPEELAPGTLRVISLRMDYLPPAAPAFEVLANPSAAYVSRYALGRDYHKLMRKRLQRLARRIEQAHGAFGYRVFVDSAPVMEKALAEKAGLGWVGKHSNIINRAAGSWFFLGEIYTDLPLPVDSPTTAHCGQCRACLDICPTQAIVKPYTVDARRCISYLTIEHHGPIPEELRPMIGNRIYGCDDCMLICPWNRFAHISKEADFAPRHGLDQATLAELIQWDEDTFLKRMEGSPIRRIGYERWLRNLSVALGNGPPDDRIMQRLKTLRGRVSDMVRLHMDWALSRWQSVQTSD